MKRAPWTKTVVTLLGILWLLSGVAWADPTGPADVIQILNVRTFQGFGGSEQKTFNRTDLFTIEAAYYDPRAACDGIVPGLVQVHFFNLEGQLLRTFDGGDEPLDDGASTKYRLLFLDLSPGDLPAGSFQVVFLATDCQNVNILISGLNLIRVLGP